MKDKEKDEKIEKMQRIIDALQDKIRAFNNDCADFLEQIEIKKIELGELKAREFWRMMKGPDLLDRYSFARFAYQQEHAMEDPDYPGLEYIEKIMNDIRVEDKKYDRNPFVTIGDNIYDLRGYFDKKINDNIQYYNEKYYGSLLAIALCVLYDKHPIDVENVWYKIGYQFDLTDEQSQALFRHSVRMNYPYDGGIKCAFDVQNDVDYPKRNKEKASMNRDSFTPYDDNENDDGGLIEKMTSEIWDYSRAISEGSELSKNNQDNKKEELYNKYSILETLFEELSY